MDRGRQLLNHHLKNVGFVVSVSTEFDVRSLVFPEFPDVPRHVLVFVPIT